MRLGDELVPIMVPLNRCRGPSTYVTAAAAASATGRAVQSISSKYGLERVLVAHASVRASTIEVQLTELSATGRASSGSFSVPLGSRTRTPLSMRQSMLLSTGSTRTGSRKRSSSLASRTNFTSQSGSPNLADWLTIQRRLKQAPNISQIEIVGLSPQGAQVHLTYGGTTDQLHITLQQVSLELNNRGSYWEIAMTEKAAPAPGATAPDVPKGPDASATH